MKGYGQGKPETRHGLILASVLAGGRRVGGEGGRWSFAGLWRAWYVGRSVWADLVGS